MTVRLPFLIYFSFPVPLADLAFSSAFLLPLQLSFLVVPQISLPPLRTRQQHSPAQQVLSLFRLGMVQHSLLLRALETYRLRHRLLLDARLLGRIDLVSQRPLLPRLRIFDYFRFG
jgi:hypothetical protein